MSSLPPCSFTQFKLMSQYLQPDASFYCHHIVFSSLYLCKWFSIVVSRSSFQVLDVKRRGIMQHTQYTCVLWEFNFFLSQCKFPVTAKNCTQSSLSLFRCSQKQQNVFLRILELEELAKLYRLTKSGSKSYFCSLCK